ncbi:MAG TPA: MMPL family transporter [Acidimicrobiales bacterium]|nr:MMPL family transporter [Acidimicrobiales bacterium]
MAFVTGRRTKFVVLFLWLVIVAAIGPLSGKLSGAEKNEAQSWLPGSAESTKVLALQTAFQPPDVLPAVVVFERQGGLSVVDREAIAKDAARLATLAPVAGPVAGPVFSADGAAAETVVPYNVGPDGWKHASSLVDRVRSMASLSGLSVHVTGPAGYAAASSDVFKGIDSTLLFATLAVVVLILLITYRSPFLWALPVIAAGVALVTAEGIVYLLADHAGLTVNAMSAGILTVLVFGAGTDYALLLVARYREELRRHDDRHDAMAMAVRRAGPALLASASTVTAGLLCLLLAETNSTSGLGPVAAVGVVVALASMTTLLPAVLVTVGRWVFWPRRPEAGSAEPTATGSWARIGVRIARYPRRIWVGTTLALGALAIGLLQFHASGLTNAQSYTGKPDAVVADQILSRHFAGGAGSPVVVIANSASANLARQAMSSIGDVASVSDPIVIGGKVELEATLQSLPDTPESYATVDRLRSALHRIPGADALVGGNSAVNLDVQRAASHDRSLIIPIILVVVFAILALLLRAVVAPLMLIATVVLSFAAALGASGLVFTNVFGFAGSDTAFPLFVFVFLVALGIDYNIFLMTRVREDASRHGTRSAAVTALAATGGVITSAGVVLAGTFAVLGTLPLTTFAEVGFSVAFGVLLDTIVVRSVLVTALNLDLADSIWWPSKLRSASDATPAAPQGRRPEVPVG